MNNRNYDEITSQKLWQEIEKENELLEFDLLVVINHLLKDMEASMRVSPVLLVGYRAPKKKL
jgi:hypothetical protein